MANRGKTYTARRKQRPKDRKKVPKSFLVLLVLVSLCLGAVYALSKTDSKAPAVSGNLNSAKNLEAVVLPDETPSIIKEYTGFTVNFNPAWHVPNYVAWELTRAEAEGNEPRNSKFRPDPDVLGCPTLDDYRNSGYDRGHMAPAGDMKWSREAMADSHYLTNMVPQDHNINSGRWSTLEKKCRQWAQRDSAIIVIAGPILSDEITRTIGASRVAVPDRFFKVLLSPYTNPVRAIGFIIPNSPTPDGVEQMVTSVDNIESITGFDFFSSLPDDIENEVETQANWNDWNRRKNRR